MFTYSQSSGEISWNGELLGTGYSGHEEGKDDSAMQDVPDVGPLPRGKYTIGAPHNTATHGPFVMALTPDPANEMFGRSGFLIHGDSIGRPGTASLGCIIMARPIRERIAGFAVTNNLLEVIA